MSITDPTTRRLGNVHHAGPASLSPPSARDGPGAPHRDVASPAITLIGERQTRGAADRFSLSAAGVRALRRVDLQPLGVLALAAETRTSSALDEELRQIKRPLLDLAHDAGRDEAPDTDTATDARSPADPAARAAAWDRRALIMVTSAGAGEGKTFIAAHLAASMASEIDTSVLLVDAAAGPTGLAYQLGLGVEKGLFDLLADPGLRLADVALQTHLPKLIVVPAGTPRGNSSEWFASDAMDALLAALVRDAPDRIVVFDTPALLGTTDAGVLAARVGQVVVVVEAGVTAREAVFRALGEVERCPHVALVLNKGRMEVIP